MFVYALKMLMGDKLKYWGLVCALAFASFIISQQGAIFVGILQRTFSILADTPQPDIWVMEPTVQYIDDLKGMKQTALYRVRSVSGVEWAVPFYKGLIQARLLNGNFQTCFLIGIDDPTLIGGPIHMLQGSVEQLRFPDAVIVNRIGAETKLAFNGKPLKVGDTMELNDHRVYVTGVCETFRTFQSQPVIYTTYNRATSMSPQVRDMLTFILVKAKQGEDVGQLAKKITAATGFAAYTTKGFEKLTLLYYAKYTGIVINFGVAIILGFIIGIAISGQTFFNFIVDNLPYFAVLKAMGAGSRLLEKMVILQAFFVSAIGWGIGIGFAAIFGYSFRNTELAFNLPWWLYLISAFSLLCICLISALFSILKVRKLDPAIVFKS